jgi:hypothetical protein
VQRYLATDIPQQQKEELKEFDAKAYMIMLSALCEAAVVLGVEEEHARERGDEDRAAVVRGLRNTLAGAAA